MAKTDRNPCSHGAFISVGRQKINKINKGNRMAGKLVIRAINKNKTEKENKKRVKDISRMDKGQPH